jgi:ASCH domain
VLADPDAPLRGKPMLALSIHQPWAWLIVNGFKNIENRDWSTKFRGRFLIHASKKMTQDDFDDAFDTFDMAVPVSKDESLRRRARFIHGPEQLGGIIGEADIVDCVDRHDSPWFFGKFGFVLANAKPLPLMPCRGQLGFFQPASSPDAPLRLSREDGG